MPDCNHSTASCSCVPATAGGGGDQGGGFLCPGASSCSGGDMLMVGCVTYKHCHQHLYLLHNLHIQLVASALLETLDKEQKWTFSVPSAPSP